MVSKPARVVGLPKVGTSSVRSPWPMRSAPAIKVCTNRPVLPALSRYSHSMKAPMSRLPTIKVTALQPANTAVTT